LKDSFIFEITAACIYWLICLLYITFAQPDQDDGLT